MIFGDIGGGIGRRTESNEGDEIAGLISNWNASSYARNQNHNVCYEAAYGGPYLAGSLKPFNARVPEETIGNEEEIRQYTWIDRESDLSSEILGLQQQEDGNVYVVTHGLHRHSLGQRSLRPVLRGEDVILGLMGQIRRLWSDQLRQHDLAEIILIEPQIPAFLTSGKEELHLIFDVQPHLGKKPALILSLYKEHGEDQGHELKAVRLEDSEPCGHLFHALGQQDMCAQPDYACRCDEDSSWLFQMGLGDWMEIGKGQRLDVLSEIRDTSSLEEDGEVDSLDLMQRVGNAMPRNRWAYVYTPGINEPFNVLDYDTPHMSRIEQIEEVYHRRQPFAGALDTILIETQPVDLAPMQADGFMVIELRRVPTGKVGILLDIEFYVNNRPISPGGPKPSEEWRECLWLPARLSRRELLKLINMEQFCLGKQDQCLVFQRGNYWNTMDQQTRTLRHGDYILVKALQRKTDVQLQYQWQCAEQGRPIDDAAQIQQQATQGMTRRRRVDSTDSDSDMSTDSDEEGLFQQNLVRKAGQSRVTSTTEARNRLPPPGNGGGKRKEQCHVGFCDEVERFDDKGGVERWKDFLISNDFVQNAWNADRQNAENAMMMKYITGLRFKWLEGPHQAAECPPSYDREHETEQLHPFLPLQRLEEEKETLDYGHEEVEGSQRGPNLPISECDTSWYGHLQNRYQPGLADELHEVCEFHRWLESIQTIPCYDLTRIPWKSASRLWHHCDTWWLQPAEQLIFFVDGSLKGNELSSAVVMYAKAAGCWYFGGFIGYHFENQRSGKKKIGIYEAELQAQVMASKWLHDEVRLQLHNYGQIPELIISYDSTAAGKATDGTFGGNQDNHYYKNARAMMQWLSVGLGLEIKEEHVPSHRGHPGNEAADDVASWAADLPRNEAPWSRFCQEEACRSVQWLWWVGQYIIPGTNKLYLNPLETIKPKAYLCENVVKEMEIQEAGTDFEVALELNLKVLTYNINSVNEGGRKQSGAKRASPTKIAALTEMYADQNVDIFMWQETRMQKKVARNEHFLLFQGLAGKKGNGGTLIGISRRLRGHGAQPVQEKNIKVIKADEELLVLRVHDPALKAIVISGHAPHTGRPSDEIKTWWSSLQTLIKQKAANWPVIFGIDANAKVGSIESNSIGSHQGSEENESGSGLHEFCITTCCWCPSTFSSSQIGPGETWQHRGGGQSRIDFLGVPLNWRTCSTWARVAYELAFGPSLFDHKPALVEMEGRIMAKVPQDSMGMKKKNHKIHLDYADEKVKKQLEEYLGMIEIPPWHMDVHCHTQALYEGIRKAVEKTAEKFNTTPRRKKHLADETWELVQAKRQARKMIFTWRDVQKRLNLQMFFFAWCKKTEEIEVIHGEWKEAVRKECCGARDFQTLGRKVTKQIRQQDEEFFSTFAYNLEKFDTPKTQRELWKELRRYLPKHQERRRTTKAEMLDNDPKMWSNHLCELEAGVEKRFTQIYQECVTDQNTQEQDNFSLNDVPTLIELEAALRTAKQGKASGPDNISSDLLHYMPQTMAKITWSLFAKTAIWACEPIQFKGGTVCWLHKKGSWQEAQNFRGILLSSSLGKRLHSLYRPPLMRHLDCARGVGQIGGVRNMETTYGNHFIRSFLRTTHAAGMVSAVVFVDLSTAFHTLVRELLIGVKDGESDDPSKKRALDEIINNLKEKGWDFENVLTSAQGRGYMESIDTPNQLRRMTKEFSRANWSQLGTCYVQSYKGSLADTMFHYLMSKANREIQTALQDEAESEELCSQLNFNNHTVVWADDLAYGLAARSNEVILQMVERVTTKVRTIFEELGMQMNFTKQKSEVLVSYRGKQAVQHRREWLSGDVEKCTVGKKAAGEDDEKEMCMTSAYKHLGCYHAAAGKLDVEINFRISQTWSVWRTLRTSIFRTRKLSKRTKIRLAHSLLMTRLLHGAEAWPLITTRQMNKVGKVYMHIMRAATSELFRPDRPESHKTDTEFLCEYGLPAIEVCVARKRLLYAARMAMHGAELMYPILEAEAKQRKDSWLDALTNDIKWLVAVGGDSWGTDIEALRNNWRNRSGWKGFVKKVIGIHTLQERIGQKILKANPRGPNKIVDLTGEYECSCGKKFSTKTGLAVHMRHQHGRHQPEYWLAKGTVCSTCLRQFWSRERLQQHFAYMPRSKRPNVCFAYQTKFFETVEIDGEEASKTMCKLQGIGRREALRLSGPLNLGIANSDHAWVEQENERWSNVLHDLLGTNSPWQCFNEELQQKLERTCETECQEDLGPLLELLVSFDGSQVEEVSTLFLWGSARRWDTTALEVDWKEVVLSYPEGPALFNWWEARQNAVRCAELRMSDPHREPAPKAKNGVSNRCAIGLSRLLFTVAESVCFPVLFNGSFWSKKQLLALGRPGCPAGELRALL